ncbi:MAG: N-methylhydantoinase B [Candidatus Binatia bacterium]|nr:MAG: N-methylhydantoinase B [Candidatus Binatia bacterium]
MGARWSSSVSVDPLTLSVFSHRLAGVAEEMGACLARSAFSPNIKERRDFSCAVFDRNGEMIAHAAHIPVHLGSAPLSVRAAIEAVDPGPGDVVVLNDPYAGGTHLPDVTLVAPVVRGDGKRIGYVANRAHHADVGGMAPGSMPLATEIYQEGLRIPPVRIVKSGRPDEELLRLFLANVRNARERRGDLLAQIASLRLGAARFLEIESAYGGPRTEALVRGLLASSERMMQSVLRAIPQGNYEAEDVLDDDGFGRSEIRIRLRLRVRSGHAVFDFRESQDQVRGGLNANRAVTIACVFYVLRCLASEPIPANAGILRPVRVLTRPGSVVDALFPSAVAGGNVETSQRIVDVILRALARALPERIPAASCGSMNNVALGGRDPRDGSEYSYYETVAGGAGGGPAGPGVSAIHTHMTNTRNTPIEALEAYYPLRVRRYAIRRNSGGRGKHPGGDGIVREIEFLAPARVSLLGERRRHGPYGLRGGGAGRPGLDRLVFADGRTKKLPPKGTFDVPPGARLLVATPGGGGWGALRRSGRRRRSKASVRARSGVSGAG